MDDLCTIHCLFSLISCVCEWVWERERGTCNFVINVFTVPVLFINRLWFTAVKHKLSYSTCIHSDEDVGWLIQQEVIWRIHCALMMYITRDERKTERTNENNINFSKYKRGAINEENLKEDVDLEIFGSFWWYGLCSAPFFPLFVVTAGAVSACTVWKQKFNCYLHLSVFSRCSCSSAKPARCPSAGSAVWAVTWATPLFTCKTPCRTAEPSPSSCWQMQNKDDRLCRWGRDTETHSQWKPFGKYL